MTGASGGAEIIIDAQTPIGFRVQVSRAAWLAILEKHPIMRGRKSEAETALRSPDQVRRSLSNPRMFLFYRTAGELEWVCAVAKQDGSDAYLITAYPTNRIKEGEHVWPT